MMFHQTLMQVRFVGGHTVVSFSSTVVVTSYERRVDYEWKPHNNQTIKQTIQQVDGYSQLYWGRGQPARDGVTPRDGLIEVEFRAGAETVFDDPRYVGQEGPTGGGSSTGSTGTGNVAS